MAKLDAQGELLNIIARWAQVEKDRTESLPTAFQQFIDSRNTVENRNPIIDAERILVFLFTINEIPNKELQLRAVREGNDAQKLFHGQMADKVKSFLAGRTHWDAIEGLLNGLIADYFDAHSPADPDDPSKVVHLFGGRGYLTPGPLATQSDLRLDQVHTTDAYSFSVTLCLNVMRLVARLRLDADDSLKGTIETLNEAFRRASERLTASMLGLLASFSLPGSDNRAGSELMRDEYKARTRREWSDHIAREIQSRVKRKLVPFAVIPDAHQRTFELGWSWGPLHPDDIVRRRGAAGFDMNEDRVCAAAQVIAQQSHIYAENAPYFYFTVSALDAIADLTSSDVQSLELLNAEQAEYAARLANLAEITREYWRIIALGDGVDWPMSRLPWSPSDTDPNDPKKQSSALWNLYLLRIVTSDISEIKDPRSIGKLIELISELADYGRITRDPFPLNADPQVKALHWPGQVIDLVGQASKRKRKVEGLQWVVYDFAPQLLKVCGSVMELTADGDRRDEMIELTSRVWEHLAKRRDRPRATRESAAAKVVLKGSWDNVVGAFPAHAAQFREAGNMSLADEGWEEYLVGSWYYTERVVEGLLSVARAQVRRPPAHPELTPLCLSLCSGLEHSINEFNAKRGRDNDGDLLLEALKLLEIAREEANEDPFIAFARIAKAGADFACVVDRDEAGKDTVRT